MVYTITRARAENIMRLFVVEMADDGSPVWSIGGDNENGKTSFITAIIMALGGAKRFPEKPLRLGETKGQVDLELTAKTGEVLIVCLKLKGPGDGSYEVAKLEVSEKRNGRVSTMKGPQAMLDALCGALMFDPLEFTRKKPKEQVEILKSLVGIDTEELDVQEKALFDQRTAVNRDLKHAEAQWAAATSYPDAPKEPVSMSDLVAELSGIQEWNAAGGRFRMAADDASRKVRDLTEKSANQSAEIAKRERQLADVKADRAETDKKLESARDWECTAKENAACHVDKSTEAVRQKMQQVEATNAQVRANAEEARLRKERDAALAESQRLTDEINAVREKRTQLMADAKWPVPGMAFDDNGVTLNGLPFKQASSAVQLRTSVQMGFAANPDLKTAIIRDGSLVAATQLRLVTEEVRAAGGQLIIEKVSAAEDVSLVITDGREATDEERIVIDRMIRTGSPEPELVTA